MYEIITYYNTGRACGIYRETLEECFEFIRNHFDGNSVEIKRDSTPLSDAELASRCGSCNYFR